jgi:hypothetical protein
VIHRVQFAIFFDDDQTRTTLNDIRRIFNCSLNYETLTGFDMPVGHFVKEWAALFPDYKLQEFSSPVLHPFFILHHLIKVAILTGGPFFDIRSLGASTAEGSRHRPADSAAAFTGVNSVPGSVAGCRTDTEFIGIFSSLLATAQHDVPAVKFNFWGAFWVLIVIHGTFSGALTAAFIPGG